MKSKESKDLELAKASLEHLINEINSGHNEVEIFNPTSSDLIPPYSGWILISFSFGSSGLPRFCSNLNWNSCLCICYEKFSTTRDTGFAKDCDDAGICMQSSFNIEEKIRLQNPPVKLNINYESGVINEPR